MLEKKIGYFDINLSINNATDTSLPYDMEIELHNAIARYSRNTLTDNQDYNKARSYEYLQKVLYADFARVKEEEDFYSIFFESSDMMIAYAGAFAGYDGDYIVVAFHQPHTRAVNIYAFETNNECDTFKVFEYDEEE